VPAQAALAWALLEGTAASQHHEGGLRDGM
jgi:hypothetical protein